MRRYFYDTEFIEYPNTIDLISIGVIGEDGQGFYAVSKEFDERCANPWVKENVLIHLPEKSHRITKKEIAEKLLDFLKPSKLRPIELWGYYSAYDHVALCWLFGAMIDLPEGMPMYTRDIKQLCDSLGNPKLPEQLGTEHNAFADALWNMKAYKFLRKEAANDLTEQQQTE